MRINIPCLRIHLYSINIEHVGSILKASMFMERYCLRISLVHQYMTYKIYIVNKSCYELCKMLYLPMHLNFKYGAKLLINYIKSIAKLYAWFIPIIHKAGNCKYPLSCKLYAILSTIFGQINFKKYSNYHTQTAFHNFLWVSYSTKINKRCASVLVQKVTRHIQL